MLYIYPFIKNFCQSLDFPPLTDLAFIIKELELVRHTIAIGNILVEVVTSEYKKFTRIAVIVVSIFLLIVNDFGINNNQLSEDNICTCSNCSIDSYTFNSYTKSS